MQLTALSYFVNLYQPLSPRTELKVHKAALKYVSDALAGYPTTAEVSIHYHNNNYIHVHTGFRLEINFSGWKDSRQEANNQIRLIIIIVLQALLAY